MDDNNLFSESTITGSLTNRAIQYSDRITLQSWFDASGRKTDEIHSVRWSSSKNNIRTLSKGLIELGLQPFDRAAVCGPNTPRWVTAVFSILTCRAAFVPIYPTSKTDDIWWCLKDSSSKIVFCHEKEHLDKVLQIKERLDVLEWIIVMDPDGNHKVPGVLSYDELMQRGKESSISEPEIDRLIKETGEEDIASIIYTSGTTGRPKGVMLSNKNFISQRAVASEFDFTPDDIWLGHLPMCHSLGFTVDLLNSGHQGGTLFIADSIETEEMRKNLRTCRPTVMTSVPRLWEKLYLQINMKVRERPGIIQGLVQWAVNTGKKKFSLTVEQKKVPFALEFKSMLAGRIFRRIREEAGLDRLRVCITGGGPIHPDLIYYFGAIGINLYQGYGLTETSPVTHTCTPANNKIGTIGKPIPDTLCKIADDGEILIKGPQVMRGYLNNPEATAETFTEDGFFKTGDIGEVDADGFYRITDRKKELIITSGGKNIAPQPIQDSFKIDPFFEQVYAAGDNRKYISALIVPNFTILEEWAAERGLKFNSREEMTGNEEVRKLYKERVDKINATLSKYESIKRFALLPDEFSEKGGELTPTLKMKRRFIEEKYKDIIDTLYDGE